MSGEEHEELATGRSKRKDLRQRKEQAPRMRKRESIASKGPPERGRRRGEAGPQGSRVFLKDTSS